MLTNVFSYVVDALNYQGIAIVAWVGVALAHVAYLRSQRRSVRPDRVPARAQSRPSIRAASSPWVAGHRRRRILKDHRRATSQFWDTWGLLLTFAIAFGVYSLSLRGGEARVVRDGAAARPGAQRSTTPGRHASNATTASKSYVGA
jgi:hypothetical protein